jgi:hypothetical protein
MVLFKEVISYTHIYLENYFITIVLVTIAFISANVVRTIVVRTNFSAPSDISSLVEYSTSFVVASTSIGEKYPKSITEDFLHLKNHLHVRFQRKFKVHTHDRMQHIFRLLKITFFVKKHQFLGSYS